MTLYVIIKEHLFVFRIEMCYNLNELLKYVTDYQIYIIVVLGIILLILIVLIIIQKKKKRGVLE